MTSGANPWKLGLFVVVGLAAVGGGAWWLGLRYFDREVFDVVTYFDESVNGLDLGAPVKMRGVPIGTVSEITFAPDRQTVEVHAEVRREVLRGLGLHAEEGLPDTAAMIARGLRVQLASTGLTGIRYLSLDYVDADRFPIPRLGFEPPVNYIPAAPSTLKSLEDGLFVLLDSVPPIAEEIQTLGHQLNEKLAALDVAGLAEQVRTLLTRADEALAQLQPGPLLESGTNALDEVRALVADGRALLSRLASEEGPIERSAERWSELARRLEATLAEAQVGATAQSLRGAGDSLRALSRELGGLSGDARAGLFTLTETLEALRVLALYLERDPGALIRGGSR